MPKVDQTLYSLDDLSNFAKELAAVAGDVEKIAVALKKAGQAGVIVTNTGQKRNAMIYLLKWLGEAGTALKRAPIAMRYRGDPIPPKTANAPVTEIFDAAPQAKPAVANTPSPRKPSRKSETST